MYNYFLCCFFLPFAFFFFAPYHNQAERVHELNEEIGKLLARAEQLGGEGNVDEAQLVLEQVEKTRAMKKEAEVRVLKVLIKSCQLSQT